MLNTQVAGRVSRAVALAAAAALVAGSAIAPASAAVREDPASEAKAGKQSDAKAPARKYCIAGPVTGTHLPKKVCKTRDEWIAQDRWDPVTDK